MNGGRRCCVCVCVVLLLTGYRIQASHSHNPYTPCATHTIHTNHTTIYTNHTYIQNTIHTHHVQRCHTLWQLGQTGGLALLPHLCCCPSSGAGALLGTLHFCVNWVFEFITAWHSFAHSRPGVQARTHNTHVFKFK